MSWLLLAHYSDLNFRGLAFFFPSGYHASLLTLVSSSLTVDGFWSSGIASEGAIRITDEDGA